jgi:hypothetical protein
MKQPPIIQNMSPKACKLVGSCAMGVLLLLGALSWRAQTNKSEICSSRAERLLSRPVNPNRKSRSSPFDMRDVRRYFPEFDDLSPGHLAFVGHESPNDA